MKDYKCLFQSLQLHLPAALHAPTIIVLTKTDLAPSESALREGIADLQEFVKGSAVSLVATSGELGWLFLWKDEGKERRTGLHLQIQPPVRVCMYTSSVTSSGTKLCDCTSVKRDPSR